MKAKPVLLIAATLLIGFILGMLTSARIRYHRLNPVRMFFSQERFREGFYKTIQPDEQQKAKIDVVLDKYARLTGDMQASFRMELDSTMKEFRKEIDGYLSAGQIAKLKEMDERRQKMIHHRRENHHADSSESERHSIHRGKHGPDENPNTVHPDANP